MNDVEQVKERSDIAEIIGGYLQLKQAGRNLKAPCPFHGEKTASFMVSPEKQIFHCFGCNEGGDVITFVMKMDGLDFRGALEVLAAKAGIELASKPVDAKAKQEKDRIAEALKLAVRYYQASLLKNKQALEYAKSRGLTRQVIKDFQIGYSPDDWNALSNFLSKNNFNPSDLKHAGLVGQKQGRSTVYDLIRGRLMFPICDGQGDPVGFTGRVLDDSLPKYINTPQTPLYDKSRIIFGLHLAKPAIREYGEVVIVEGNMDVVASHQAGVKQVVAVSGTAMTLDQLKTLSRLTKNIKICFDADEAGLRATERAIEISQSLGLQLTMIKLPDAKDPDELIKKGVEHWRQAIKNAQYVLDYLFDRFEGVYDINTATGKRQYSDRLAGNLQRLGDPVEKDHYIQKLSKKLEISEDAIREKVEQVQAPNTQRPTPNGKRGEGRVSGIEGGQTAANPQYPAPNTHPSKNNPPETNSARRHLEEAILAINLAYPEVRLSIDDITAAHFDSIERQTILEALRAADQAGAAQIADDLAAEKSDLPKLSDYVKILTLRGEETYDSFAPADRSFEAFELARRLQKQSNKELKSKLTRKLREAELIGDADLARMLREEYHALMKEDH